ncbi:MAG: tyrosine-type recombinase/integrase [Nannocystis sp.]|nr:tyrosine-type recombinase/integrase [Nannocystis sp.]
MAEGNKGQRTLVLGDLDELVTADEAAALLKVSPRTLEKWRLGGSGPSVLRIGRRVAYARRDLLTWLSEQEAKRRNPASGEELSVSVRPYFKDRSRQHVDIRMRHPHESSRLIRQRLVAPVEMDAAAALEWGRAESLRIYRELCRRPVELDAGGRGGRAAKIKTLEEYWALFEAGHVAELKYTSRLSYATLWAQIRPILGQLRLDAIDERALSHLRSHLRQVKKLSLGYTRQICEAVRVALRHARDDGELPKRCEVPKLTWPKQRRAKVEVYSREDLEKIVAAAANEEERVLLLLLTDAALRIGEAAGLMWKDLHLERHQAEIRRCVAKGMLQETAKGEDGVIALSPRLAAALREYPPRGEFLFVPDGAYSPHSAARRPAAYVQEGTLAMRVRRAEARAGLTVYGPHRIRHSVLTLLAHKGVSPYALQALARHAQLSTTMKYYVHLQQGQLAAQAVTALFEPIG